MLNWTATIVRPMNRTPRRIAIAVMVFAAFFASGGLNAGTPLAMASTPVSATEPPANALSRRSTPSASVAEGDGIRRASPGSTFPVTIREKPIATIPSARKTNRYVGMAKMFPDSRRPRRFAIVMSEIETNAIAMR